MKNKNFALKAADVRKTSTEDLKKIFSEMQEIRQNADPSEKFEKTFDDTYAMIIEELQKRELVASISKALDKKIVFNSKEKTYDFDMPLYDEGTDQEQYFGAEFFIDNNQRRGVISIDSEGTFFISLQPKNEQEKEKGIYKEMPRDVVDSVVKKVFEENKKANKGPISFVIVGEDQTEVIVSDVKQMLNDIEEDKKQEKIQKANEKRDMLIGKMLNGFEDQNGEQKPGYLEKYKDNPNLLSVLTPENLNACLVSLSIIRKPYKVVDSLAEELNGINEQIKKNAPSITTLFRAKTPRKIVEGFSKYAPETYETYFEKDFPQELFKNPEAQLNATQINISRAITTMNNLITKNYIRKEHKDLTGQNVNQTIKDLKDGKIEKKDHSGPLTFSLGREMGKVIEALKAGEMVAKQVGGR